MWVLEVDLGSLGRIASAFNYLAISPAHVIVFSKALDVFLLEKILSCSLFLLIIVAPLELNIISSITVWLITQYCVIMMIKWILETESTVGINRITNLS